MYMTPDHPTYPTFARLTGPNDRQVRSLCCHARTQTRFQTTDTTAGAQLVYACNQCGKLYVVRERDVYGRGDGL
jgi:hypothetical protein